MTQEELRQERVYLRVECALLDKSLLRRSRRTEPIPVVGGLQGDGRDLCPDCDGEMGLLYAGVAPGYPGTHGNAVECHQCGAVIVQADALRDTHCPDHGLLREECGCPA